MRSRAEITDDPVLSATTITRPGCIVCIDNRDWIQRFVYVYTGIRRDSQRCRAVRSLEMRIDFSVRTYRIVTPPLRRADVAACAENCWIIAINGLNRRRLRAPDERTSDLRPTGRTASRSPARACARLITVIAADREHKRSVDSRERGAIAAASRHECEKHGGNTLRNRNNYADRAQVAGRQSHHGDSAKIRYLVVTTGCITRRKACK